MARLSVAPARTGMDFDDLPSAEDVNVYAYDQQQEEQALEDARDPVAAAARKEAEARAERIRVFQEQRSYAVHQPEVEKLFPEDTFDPAKAPQYFPQNPPHQYPEQFHKAGRIAPRRGRYTPEQYEILVEWFQENAGKTLTTEVKSKAFELLKQRTGLNVIEIGKQMKLWNLGRDAWIEMQRQKWIEKHRQATYEALDAQERPEDPSVAPSQEPPSSKQPVRMRLPSQKRAEARRPPALKPIASKSARRTPSPPVERAEATAPEPEPPTTQAEMVTYMPPPPGLPNEAGVKRERQAVSKEQREILQAWFQQHGGIDLPPAAMADVYDQLHAATKVPRGTIIGMINRWKNQANPGRFKQINVNIKQAQTMTAAQRAAADNWLVTHPDEEIGASNKKERDALAEQIGLPVRDLQLYMYAWRKAFKKRLAKMNQLNAQLPPPEGTPGAAGTSDSHAAGGVVWVPAPGPYPMANENLPLAQAELMEVDGDTAMAEAEA